MGQKHLHHKDLSKDDFTQNIKNLVSGGKLLSEKGGGVQEQKDIEHQMRVQGHKDEELKNTKSIRTEEREEYKGMGRETGKQ